MGIDTIPDDLRSKSIEAFLAVTDTLQYFRSVFQFDSYAINHYFERLSHSDQKRQALQWNTLALLGLSLVSTTSCRVAEQVFLQRWITTLGEISDHPETLRTIMRETGTIVSGSRPVAYALPGLQISPNDIDCYTPIHRFDDFCNFVVSQLGGVIQLDLAGVPEYSDTGTRLCMSRGIAKRRRIVTPKATFDIVCSVTSCAFFPIAYLPSSAVMKRPV